MACKNTYNKADTEVSMETTEMSSAVAEQVDRLLFGVESETAANTLLQNNLDLFEWVVRNKIYPNFFGRYITGENSLTEQEIAYLHEKGCKIAVLCAADNVPQSDEGGKLFAKKMCIRALELGIPAGTAIFLELREKGPVGRDFLRGYAKELLTDGFIPGFKANTDARFAFDREFSRGMQTDREVFRQCLVWAVAPTVKEYDGMTTTHLIHPDNWTPFAPSGVRRREIAVWQYGNGCHQIEDDSGAMTSFDLDLVRNESVIVEKMF